jgi:phage N-6-adenine-methyltransferase
MNEQTRKVMHSSESMNWRTPKDLFGVLNEEFCFTLDAAADEFNALCDCFFTEHGKYLYSQLEIVEIESDVDGLTGIWDGKTFCNPPYGRGIGAWFEKAYNEAQLGKTCVLLVPARTDTAYWHEYAMKADEIRLIRGRVKFESEDGKTLNSAPFPSAIVIFRKKDPEINVRVRSWSWK